MRRKEKQKTALIRKSVFPESRESLTCFERDTDALFLFSPAIASSQPRLTNLTAAAKKDFKKKRKQKTL